MTLKQITDKLAKSSLFKDSMWAVFGNGMGNFLLLLAGILIARLLGKDIYGEYGLVKTTMFHIATFSTLGLGFTSTRFVAKYRNGDENLLLGTISSSLVITTITSISLCVILFIFSKPLAIYLNEPRLYIPFRFLGIIIVFKALSTTTNAILAGNKNFKSVGINTIVSGASMLLFSVLFTYLWGLKGSLLALAISQLLLCVLNFINVCRVFFINRHGRNLQRNYGALLKFTFPVALQELSYTLSQWGMMLILTKFGSLGEVGLFTAAAQWNAIILFIPVLLSNVVLSYLSGSSSSNEQTKTLKRMLLVNLASTLLPFMVIYIFTDFIVSFYGTSFTGMNFVMNVLVFSTIFDSMCRVFQSNLISEGKNWMLFIFRAIRDLVSLIFAYLLLSNYSENAARTLSILTLIVSISYFGLMSFEYLLSHKKQSINNL